MRSRSDRSGFILPAAIACIVIMALLATAALFASTQESAVSRARVLDQQATSYAERVALLAVEDWQCGKCDSIAVGGVNTETPAPDHPFESTVYVTRLDSALFLVVGEGSVRAGTRIALKRQVAIAVRIHRDSLGQVSALPLHPYAWVPAYGM